ncbi:unnamed protein product [Clonostachys byssicola]|uniref:Uncharacterized protein n=1 Tax=Clonostachys byssicola TaxID=160290 RepID=A0A9N9UHU5_9HYPO|nr:unnamed protein product [Clonostachys byssicola]
MKSLQCLIVANLVCASSAAFLPRSLLAYFGLSESNIPRFIREINHPYIKSHQHDIESLSDPTEALCNPHSQFRASLPDFPDDLFRRLSVDNNKVSRGRRGWTNAREVLSDILSCKAALGGVEEFEVDIFLQRGDDEWFGEAPTPSDDILDLFVRFFANTPRLSNLTWVQPSADSAAAATFEKYFFEQNVEFPALTEASLGPNMHYLLAGAPHLRKLTSYSKSSVWSIYSMRSLSQQADGPQMSFVKVTSKLKRLEEFGLHATWTAELVAELLQSAGQLVRLDVDGGVDGRWAGDNLGAMARELNKFENLRQLRLPHVIHLGFGSSDELPDCGNAYFGASGRVLRRQEQISHIFSTEKAAEIIFPLMPNLEKLCIGGECTEIALGKELKWPWTGRLRDYMLEEWPRWESGTYGYRYEESEDPQGPVLESWEEDRKWFGGSDGHGEL